jgi:adhesin/invasin
MLTIQDNVPFNVDPAAAAVSLIQYGSGTIRSQLASPLQMTLTSTQTMTYVADTGDDSTGLAAILTCPNSTGLAGTTPGQISIQLSECSDSPGGWGDLTFTTSGNNIRVVPVTVMPARLFPLINPGGIVNDATFSSGPVAPGSIVAIFGLDLANSVSSYSPPLPPSYAFSPPNLGVSPVPSDDALIGIFYQSPTQWNIQIPYGATPGNYLLQIGNSPQVAFTVAATAPYIFNWGGNHGSILNADNSLNTPDAPAAAGSFMQVYLTGQGAVDPPVINPLSAAPATPLSYVVATTTATIDGAPAVVSFAGLAPGFVGLCQVNINIPSGLPAGQHKLVITMGSVNSNEVVFDSK